MFMKLDDLRKFDFINKIKKTRETPANLSIVGDQDIINILFHNQTGKTYFHFFEI